VGGRLDVRIGILSWPWDKDKDSFVSLGNGEGIIM